MTSEQTRVEVPNETKSRLAQERAEYKAEQLRAAKQLAVEIRQAMADSQATMPGWRGELGRALLVGQFMLDTSLIAKLEDVFDNW
jgi:hypothetical protein